MSGLMLATLCGCGRYLDTQREVDPEDILADFEDDDWEQDDPELQDAATRAIGPRPATPVEIALASILP